MLWLSRVENDDLHENTGESSCSLATIAGDPSRKLKSQSRATFRSEKE